MPENERITKSEVYERIFFLREIGGEYRENMRGKEKIER